MDFTYIAALLFSTIVGFMVFVVFAFAKAKAYWRWMAAATVLAVLLDFALLVDWRQISTVGPTMLLTDLVFFTGYGAIGIMIGSLPVLAVRGLLGLLGNRRPN